MSQPSWQGALTQTLNQLAQNSNRVPRVAIIGMGHEFNGDDAAGPVIARALIERTAGSHRLLVIDAGPAPENTTGALRRFEPDLVLMVDAAQMGEPPGAVRWLDWEQTTGVSASTHSLPPHVLARYMVAEFDCHVALIGIQPFANQIDAPLTPGMQATVADVIDALTAALID
ncbi:MAG TPA: hydrogenase 3 maturation endopeptidase HyCI [Aggregatilinea sp.]|uniref:hydrogenase 3 maturation endopeptidase HyCI n=1 Tax=Aggregatilinea sp. TaxID=2806333 RepID=UPI002BA2D50B|nr:hydrogenase 3 maturation endopeptidase HyCI [Aggregatilinea sp.]HML24513.1 hydrogenase 3 maturation endopeptidase HyCI [Aggregatilinea sp.]